MQQYNIFDEVETVPKPDPLYEVYAYSYKGEKMHGFVRAKNARHAMVLFRRTRHLGKGWYIPYNPVCVG